MDYQADNGHAVVADNLVKNYVTFDRKGFFRKVRKVVRALRGVSFKVEWGEVFGLLGPNGAGKTTTVKVLTTLLLPDEGTAYVNGYDILKEPILVRESIGVVLNVERGFFWKLTGRENLRYFGMLRGMKSKDLEDAIERVAKAVGLDKLGAIDKLYEEYSLGMKARLALARALLPDPPILILDEPTLGLDPPAAREIRSLLVRLARDGGKAVMVTTHNMFEAELICDKVAIISAGKIAAVGTVPELKRLVAEEVPIYVKFAGTPPYGIEKLVKALERAVGTAKVRVKEVQEGFEARVLVPPGREENAIADVVTTLTKYGMTVLRAEVVEPTLEDVFIEVTKR